MGILIETKKGWTEAILDSNCDYDIFYKTAEILQKDFQANFVNKLDDYDSLYWDFIYKGSRLILHYNIYLGVSIFPAAFKLATQDDNETVIEIGNLLFDRLKEKT